MTKQEFLEGVENWSNHRPLLWEALETIKGSSDKRPVLEMGCGKGSTRFLHQYCKEHFIPFVSLDSDENYAKQYEGYGTKVVDWNDLNKWFTNRYSVVLMDHAPGGHRRTALQLFATNPDKFDIIVLHDSEPAGWNAGEYQVREVFERFKYVKDYVSPKPGAWATALSNTIDVTKFEI